MKHVLFCCILLNAAVSGLNVNKAMKLDPTLERCVPKEGEEIAGDKFVAQMFKAFKEEALTEDPPVMNTAKDLKDTDGHELLARSLFFIDSVLHATVNGKNEPELLSNLTELSQRYQSEGPDLASDQQWPYRCYSAEQLKALDLYLSDMLLQIVSLVKNEKKDLAMFLHGLAMNLPQLQDYVGEMVKPSITSMCSLIEESQDRGSTVREIIRTLEGFSSKTQIAEVACSSPYNSHAFCLFSKVKATLQLFLIDYRRAGSSMLMKKFAFFWFFEPDLSSFCSDQSSVKLKAKILAYFATSEEEHLRAIINIQGGENPTKVRSFIMDHVFNHFTSYMAEDITLKRLKPRGHFSPAENKFIQFRKREYPSVKPTDNFLKCFNVFLTTLGQMDEAIGRDSSKLRALAQVSLLWLMHPDFGTRTSGLYQDFLQGLNYFLKNTTALKEFGLAVGSCGSSSCKPGSVSSPSTFCEINKVLGDIRLFAISLSSSSKTKILTPLTVDYRRILSQEGSWSIQSKLEQQEKRNKRLRRTFSSIQSEVNEHFTQAAELAYSKAQHYARVLLRMVITFFKRIGEVGLEEKLNTLFQNILKASAEDVVKKAQLLARAVVNTFNPLRWLVDAPSVQGVLHRFSQVNQVLGILGDAFQKIYAKSLEISNVMESTANFHKKVKSLLVNLTENREIVLDTVVEDSLGDHRNPEWPKENIEEHTSLMNGLIEKLCDILYVRGTASAVEPQVFEGAKSTCLKIRKDSEIIGGIHKEMQDFQYEFMEIMASISRALVTKRSAIEVARIPIKTSDVQLSNLKLEIYKYRVKIQARLHIHDALTTICDELEYKNGGVQTEVCLRGMLTQSRDDSEKILATNIEECPSAQMRNVHVRIPGTSNPNMEFIEKGNIDLTALYAGKETIFEIPFSENLPWLHRFASNALPVDPDVAMYLKRFELFLPEMTGPSQPISYDLRIAISLGNFAKTMPSGETKYGFSHQKVFELSYGENKEKCNTGFKDSPYPKLCHEPKAICVEKRGELPANEIALPLYGKWLIRGSLPKGLPIPKPYPGTSFYLRAVMSICVSNPRNVNLGGSPPVSITGSSGSCCPEGGFWNIDRDLPTVQFCLQCPTNSAPNLGGLYCQETSQGHNKRSRRKEYKEFSKGHYKSFSKQSGRKSQHRNSNKYYRNSYKSFRNSHISHRKH